MKLVLAGVLGAAAITAGVAAKGQDAAQADVKRAEAVITAAGLLGPIRELSSDAYAGRAPGTEGETRSVAYLIAQCRRLGLEPGGANGSWTQTVPLWGMLTRGSMQLGARGQTLPIAAGKDYVAWTFLPEAKTDLTSDAVFAGYGVVAPEFHWDDYAGVDVRGKTVFLLTGDPPVADPADATKLNDRMFLGKALTIYGRTGTKLETAYRYGAAAVVLIAQGTQTSPALFANYTRENMTLRGPGDRDHVRANALLGMAPATAFFSAAGADLPKLREAAAKPGFRAVVLQGKAAFHLETRVRRIDSANVLAKITGSDPRLRDEYVVYSGHWDHHGQVGTQIYHGASDNAAGSAGVLELAHAFRQLQPAPRRSILFFWPTAEEKGLLGARYYVEHPVYPLAKTIADINLDYFSNWGWGRTHDFSIVGIGNSTLDDVAASIVKSQGRVVTGDTAPEQGFYFRSDHYEFGRAGVPSIETSPGIDYVGKPASYGIAKRTEYITHDYHQPSDVVKPDWDLSGAVEDLDVLFELGYRVAQTDGRPAWKPDAVWRPKPQ